MEQDVYMNIVAIYIIMIIILCGAIILIRSESTPKERHTFDSQHITTTRVPHLIGECAGKFKDPSPPKPQKIFCRKCMDTGKVFEEGHFACLPENGYITPYCDCKIGQKKRNEAIESLRNDQTKRMFIKMPDTTSPKRRTKIKKRSEL